MNVNSNKVFLSTSLNMSFDKLTTDLSDDSDSDGMSDYWEEHYNFNITDSNDAVIDSDNDGLTNFQEFDMGTDPHVHDSDGDEVNTFNSNPLEADTDNVNINDDDEINTHGTNPNLADSDNDGLNDYE